MTRKLILYSISVLLMLNGCGDFNTNTVKAKQKKHTKIQSSISVVQKVVKIKDGDTVEILDENNETHAIRLAHIDAPEKKQDFGTQAKKQLSDLCYNKEVRLEGDKKDRNGRLLAVIYCEGRNVNLAMIEAGMAWHYKKFSQDTIYANAENKARASKTGLWSMPIPVAPWDFRK